VARENFVTIDGYEQPAPAPKFGLTPARPGRVPDTGGDTDALLQALGYTPEKLQQMREQGAI